MRAYPKPPPSILRGARRRERGLRHTSKAMKRAQATLPRRVLCVFPRYTKSFGTFENAYPFVGTKAFMPPQGILVIAAYLPEAWDVRFIDENVRPATSEDFAWSEIVFVSG